MNKYAAWFMILCSMALMQWHGAHFWYEQTGDWISGIGISFCLEVAMLSLWYVGLEGFLWCAKWVAAFLLIAGPWYQMTSPTIGTLQTAIDLNNRISTINNEVAELIASKQRYESNSDKRPGWRQDIRMARTDLKEVRAKREALLDERASLPFIWRPLMAALMQAAALLIVLTAQLAAVTSLRSRNGSTVTKTVTAKRNVTRNAVTEQNLEDYEATVTAVAAEITRQVEELGSQAKLCRQIGLRHEHIAAVLKHEEKKEAGEATITPKMLQKMVGVLEVAA